MREFYRRLLALRRETPALRSLDLAAVETRADDERRVLFIRRANVLLAFNFSDAAYTGLLPFGEAGQPLLATGASIDGGKIILPASGFGLWMV